MKKWYVAVFIVILLTGCKTQKMIPNDNEQKEEKIPDYHIKEDSVSKIEIMYPDLDFDEYVEPIVKEIIEEYLYRMYGDFDDLDIELNSSITYLEENMVSIIFEGMGNRKMTVHPTNLFYSININLEDYTLLKLSDFYVIDDAFIKIYREHFKDQVFPEIKDLLDDMSDEELKELFLNADDSMSRVRSYYTKDKVGITLDELAHAIGDYIKIEIPKDELRNNQK